MSVEIEVSEVSIANLALQKVGAAPIASLTEGSVNSDAVLACFAHMRNAELRAHTWNFSIVRAQLATLATTPLFGRANAFVLPADFLRLAPPDWDGNSPYRDWQIEARSILTNDGAPLEVRYVSRVTDPTLFDSCFVDALAAKIALQICEVLTQSSTKKQDITAEYKDAIRKAKRTDAVEDGAGREPEDTFILSRLRGNSGNPGNGNYGWGW